MAFSYSDLKVLSIGASRNIGYHTALRLLGKGATVTCLLRKRAALADDPAAKPFLESGKLRIVEGDGLVEADVARAWTEAAAGPGRNEVDFLVFTVGALPSFSLTKGFYQTPPDLVTRCMLNALITMPSPTTRTIVVSTTGLTHAGHQGLPLPLKPLYSWLLDNPHVDKRGMERVVLRAIGRGLDGWSEKDKKSSDPMLPAVWEGRLAEGSRPNIVVVRAALLLDGEAKGDAEGATAPYRIRGENDAGYTINRKDVAHFIAEKAVSGIGEYAGKIVSISY